MPDLKSEMSKVLNEWEQDAQQTQEKQVPKQIFTPTNNVTQETFIYVRDNPNKTSSEVCDALETRGFKRSSVGSLLTQFVKQNQMTRDHNNRLRTSVPRYVPLKSTRQFKAEGKRANKIVQIKSKQPSAGIAALQVDTTPKVAPKVSSQWDADTIINNIGLKQARALYDELKKLFGG
jgi:hypothetical protein